MKIECSVMGYLFLIVTSSAYSLDKNCIDYQKADREVISTLFEKGIIKKTDEGYFIDDEYLKQLQLDIKIDVEEVGSDTICR